MRHDSIKRKCLHCGKPFSIHAHMLQKYCRRVMLPDGTVFCCKDDFHNKKRRPDYHSVKNLNKKLIAIDKILKKIYDEGKLELPMSELPITPEDYTYARILVNPETGNTCFVFLSYTLEKIGDDKFKLIQNEDEASTT